MDILSNRSSVNVAYTNFDVRLEQLRVAARTLETEADRLVMRVSDAERRAEAAEATIASIRTALGGYPDSDLVSLATAIIEELADTLAKLIGCDGDEGRDTTADVARWEAIMGDKWQGG